MEGVERKKCRSLYQDFSDEEQQTIQHKCEDEHFSTASMVMPQSIFDEFYERYKDKIPQTGLSKNDMKKKFCMVPEIIEMGKP